MEGGTYPPPRVNELLSSGLFIVRMAVVLLLLAGPGVLQSIGIQNPPWIYTWAHENKMTTFLVIFIIGGQIENQLLSTGAFEVSLNDELVWSKLETGRLPSLMELKELISEPSQSFESASTVMEAEFDDEMESFYS
ncbi:selenoprotein T2-like [Halichondria panicea]|uniref:selenoprotein T2-like n=1 Tax=Halichondria panicea TaxID=6063 RepID=UPI00312B2E3D